jgi:meso-butanediol dehydrogenase/(S,S)-butanediol dehydrogenase/diacetyl reductase
MGHNAIVTGGSRGIGRAIVDRLLADGAHVVTCGRDRRPGDLAGEVVWVGLNVGDPDSADLLVSTAHDAFGPVSLLVNNAGVQVTRTTLDSSDADWDSVIGVNCRAVFRLCRSVLPDMITAGGVIVNIGSISGVVADPSMALYNASKAFVHALTRSVAVDHGPAVRCNAVLPGWIQTEMADDAFAGARDVQAARRDALARHPAGRLGVPRDVADMVAWLASDQAQFVTGQCFTVDGGLSVRSPLDPQLF